MLPEPIRWSHATGKRVVPSPWQMTVGPSESPCGRLQTAHAALVEDLVNMSGGGAWCAWPPVLYG